MTGTGRRRTTAWLLLAVLLLVAACSDDERPPLDRAAGAGAPSPTTSIVERPRGGSLRISVWSEPDLSLDTAGGQAVRSLVWPSLFVAQPDGSWQPSLVEPGSVVEAPDGVTKSFRLRDGAVWSDGSGIGVADLRRTADERFVARIGGPAPDGTITVELTRPVRGWQRLWSGADAIEPVDRSLYGGPFVIEAHQPGLEVVLARNDRWWGPGPFLDQVRLVLVPDPTTLGQLFERGQLDVIDPMAATALHPALAEVAGPRVARTAEGGTWFGVVVNGDEVRREHRAALLASVPRIEMVKVLLDGEAALLDTFDRTVDDGGTWAGVDRGDVAPLRARSSTQVTGYEEVPMSGLVQRAMQRAARDAGASIELRNGDAALVTGWLASGDYEAALVRHVDPPWPCFTCRWGDVAADLAAAADGGSPDAVAALETFLRDEALVLPLWRPVTSAAWQEGVGGVRANGFAPSVAWNAWEWWIDG